MTADIMAGDEPDLNKVMCEKTPDYNITFKNTEHREFCLEGFNHLGEKISLDGNFAEHPDLVLKDCKFDSLYVKNFDNVIIKNCEFNCSNSAYTAMQLKNINDAVVESSTFDSICEEDSDFGDRGILFHDIGSISFNDIFITGFSCGFSCFDSEVVFKNVILKDNSVPFDIKRVRFCVFKNIVLGKYDKILSSGSDLTSCEIEEFDSSPAFKALMLEKI